MSKKSIIDWEKLVIITSDKFGVPLRMDEAGTFTKEECIRRGFDPDKCQWLLKPELRGDKGNEIKRDI